MKDYSKVRKNGALCLFNWIQLQLLATSLAFVCFYIWKSSLLLLVNIIKFKLYLLLYSTISYVQVHVNGNIWFATLASFRDRFFCPLSCMKPTVKVKIGAGRREGSMEPSHCLPPPCGLVIFCQIFPHFSSTGSHG